MIDYAVGDAHPTTLYASELVDKPRAPRTLFGRFIRLPPNCVGIYGDLKSGIIVAADDQGRELGNMALPQKYEDWSSFVFGAQHLALKTMGGILAYSLVP